MNENLKKDVMEIQNLLEIYAGEKRDLLEKVEKVISAHAEDISDSFYDKMLSIPETLPFLDHKIVNERLHASLAKWIKKLFFPRNEAEVKAHLMRQLEVGNVHARIDVPMHLVNHGIRLLKREFGNYLRASLEEDELTDALVLINELLDYSIATINESYMADLVVNERNAQSLKMQISSHDLAIECEKLRSSLFDWLRKVLLALYQGAQTPPSIYSSDFGLWIMYKADMIFSNYQNTLEKLKEQTQKIDQTMKKAMKLRDAKDSKACSGEVEKLNELVTSTGWLLSSFVEHTLEMESGRDPLTRLFNRRYMTTILQQAVKVSVKHKLEFSVLLFDIDHFKQVNDTYGHEAGDSILVEFAERLMSNVRTNDYIFRYGGEEILVLLNGTSLEEAEKIAEKLRRLIANKPFFIDENKSIHITASIGIASHDGHPDYSRVIRKADEALYRAKTAGRNRVVVASD